MTTEVYPSDDELTAMAGSTSAIGLPYMTPGNNPFVVDKLTKENGLARMLAGNANALRVFKDSGGDLKCGVTAGTFSVGGESVQYAGATAQALTDDDDNYIYLTAAGVLTINTAGFPAQAATPHLPLATIATGTASAAAVSGQWNLLDDLVDCRGACFLTPVGGAGLEASTAGVGAPNVLTTVESGKTLTNEGATELNYHTLPTAEAGLVFTFLVRDENGMRITAAAGDTIELDGVATKAGGYVESTTAGDRVTLIAINATEWVDASLRGAWTVETA